MIPGSRRRIATVGCRNRPLLRVGALTLAAVMMLAGCDSSVESAHRVGGGTDGGRAAANAVASSAHARGGSSSLKMLSEVVGRGAPVDEATCLALDVEIEVADDGRPVPPTGTDAPLVVARDDPRLIDGLRRGIEGMAVDGHRSMLIPPSLAYGAAGRPDGAVGPADTLRADVAVLWAGVRPSWTWAELRSAAGAGGAALDLERGSGAPFAANMTGMVLVDAVDLDDETVMASMWDGCVPHPLDMGSLDLPGWFLDQLVGIRPGGTRLVVAPDSGPGTQRTDHTVNAWVVTLGWTDR